MGEETYEITLLKRNHANKSSWQSRTTFGVKFYLLRYINHSSAFVQDLINSTLQDIVSDELRKIKGPLDGSSAPKCCNATDDMIWEYDGLQTAYKGDCEEILLEMQRIFYEDLGRGESREG